jgi:hypothetical protein
MLQFSSRGPPQAPSGPLKGRLRKAQGRDSQWEVESSSTAAPQALAGGRSSRGEGTTKLVLVGFQGSTSAPCERRDKTTAGTLTIEGGYSSKSLCDTNTPAIKVASKPTIARKATTIHIAVCTIFTHNQAWTFVLVLFTTWHPDACSAA